MNADYGQVAFSAQGWLASGFANVPTLPNSWNLYSQSLSRLVTGKLSPIPAAVFVNSGTTDGSSNIQSTVVSWLAAIRAAVNANTPIIIIIPFNQNQQANLAAAIVTAADPYVYTLNLGTSGTYGIEGTLSFPTATRTSYDGLHPDVPSSGFLATMLAGKIQNSAFGFLISGSVAIRGMVIQ